MLSSEIGLIMADNDPFKGAYGRSNNNMDEYSRELYNEVDEYGKRYRIIGNIKEYEPEITLSCGSVPASQVKKTVDNMSKMKPPAIEKVETKSCPFKHSNMRINCITDCVLYINGKCTLSKLGDKDKTVDTTNKKCPFSGRSCRSDCFLNNGGCVLAKLKE